MSNSVFDPSVRVDHGAVASRPRKAVPAGGTLVCKCADKPVKVAIQRAIGLQIMPAAAQNAGSRVGAPCSQWSPWFRATSWKVTDNADKLKVVDPAATIQRHACKGCGVHMYGRIENTKHPLYGFDFYSHGTVATKRLVSAGICGIRVIRSSNPARIRPTWAPCAAA